MRRLCQNSFLDGFFSSDSVNFGGRDLAYGLWLWFFGSQYHVAVFYVLELEFLDKFKFEKLDVDIGLLVGSFVLGNAEPVYSEHQLYV